jgi:hypothetical protein
MSDSKPQGTSSDNDENLPEVPSDYKKMPGGITGKGWLPGKSGNPGGQPKGKRLTTLLRDALDREHNGKAIAEIIAEVIVREALKGDYRFVKEIMERIDGKVPDRLTGDDGEGLTVIFKRAIEDAEGA